MINFKVEGEDILYSFPYNPDLIESIKSVNCGAYWNKPNWIVPLRNYKYLPYIFKNQQLDVIYYDFIKEENEEIDRKWELVNNCNGVEFPKIKGELLPHQKSGIVFLKEFRKCILNHDLGLGKSVQAIVGVMMLKQQKEDLKVLVICPSSLKYHWTKEITKFTDETYSVVDGGWSKRLTQYKSPATFIITSYELVRMKNDINLLKNMFFDVIVGDEISRIKNMRSKTNKAIRQLKSKYIWCLTGSSIENRLEDLYSIMLFINPRHFGRYSRFKEKYMIIEPRTFYNQRTGRTVYYDEVMGYKHLDQLQDMLPKFLYRLNKRDVLKDLPERSEVNYFVKMTTKQGQIYEEYLTEAKESGEGIFAHIVYLREIANSPKTVEESMDVESGKLNELKNILMETKEKVIIFSDFLKMAKIIKLEVEKLGKKVILVSGEMKSKEKMEAVDRFEKEDLDVLISTNVLSLGMNLQFAHTLINFSLPWNPINLEQKIGRIDRFGQKSKTLIINLITKNTIEERVFEILTEKKELIKRLGLMSLPNPKKVDEEMLKILLKK